MSVRLLELGGITPGVRCLILEVAGKRIAIDAGCGFAYDKVRGKYTVAPEFGVLRGERLDAVIITHDHFDHVGAAPLLARFFPGVLFYMTKPARAGAKLIINDSLKIHRNAVRDAERAGKPVPTPLYEDEDAEAFFSRVRPVDRPHWIHSLFGEKGWSIGFYPSGHKRGAMMTFLQTPERNIVITGDCSAHDQPYVKGTMLPPDDFIRDFMQDAERKHGVLLITEATNGARELPDQEAERRKMNKVVVEVRDRGGVCLFPCFGSDGCSRVSMRLDDTSHLDGMARDFYLQVYATTDGYWSPNDQPSLEEMINQIGTKILPVPKIEYGNFEAVRRFQEQLAQGYKGSYPIVTPSSTLEEGNAVTYAKHVLQRRENAVIFTGHIFPGTKSEEVMKLEKGRTVTLGRIGESLHVPVACEVYRFDFSAHDGGGKLAKRVELYHAPDVGIQHGDHVNLEGLRARLYNLKQVPRVERLERLSEVVF